MGYIGSINAVRGICLPLMYAAGAISEIGPSCPSK